jgi:DNA-binding beta-propeller fold protein YncE
MDSDRHTPKTTMTRLGFLLALLSFVCMGVGPVGSPDPKAPSPAKPKAITAVLIRPMRVVYRHIEGTYLKSPRGVFVDNTRGEIYVADTKNNLVAVYDLNGLPLFAFGYNGELEEPVKAVADPAGRLYVLTGAPRKLKVFNYRGEYLDDFPFGTAEVAPDALTVDSQRNIYIADKVSKQILVYDSDYRLILKIGAKNGGGSYFESVKGITVDPDGDVYVADATAVPAVLVFGPEGEFIRGWGEHGMGPENVSLPSGVALDGEGRVLVVDTIRQAILIYDRQGTLLQRFGGMGTAPGNMAFPADVATDGNAGIYVVERVGNRLQILKQNAAAPRNGRASAQSRRKAMKKQVRRFIEDFLGRN